ncbi:FIST signal transduction protein [Rhodoferax sp. BLA1]|uniref:FIST signal transduction protein n=1 Tax=Rhodoferax sp. BLA1 TaxID=2576062 RepID=UPI0015D31AF6|nr:FIST N-terminal domain-containing protein [Rhodoferax sp. BLA1]
MRVIQTVLRQASDLAEMLVAWGDVKPQLVLAFGSVHWLKALHTSLAGQLAPGARLGCTSAGEISNQGVTDDSCVVTGIRFESVRVLAASACLAQMSESFAAGQRLGQQLPKAGLRLVWVLGQGIHINGSALIAGLVDVLGDQVLITGGLAGDGAAFKTSFVLDNSGVHPDRVSCVGLYGEQLQVAHGSFGGWEQFGPARKVTRCQDNVLFELDGEPALEIYKRYLGDHARNLPISGLLFLMAMLGQDQSDVGLIRTILGVDEAQGSLILAGDIDPQGYLRLMHASTDALVDGAETAARLASACASSNAEGLALLVSCVGRKLVMGDRVDEEVEAVADVFRQKATLAGFYSYGEICPMSGALDCKLHNQTMTITYLTEIPVTQ